MNERPTKDQAMVPQRTAAGAKSNDVDTTRRSQGVADSTGPTASGLPATGRAASDSTGQSLAPRGTESAQGTGEGASVTGPLAQMHKLIERAGEEPFPSDVIRILSEQIDDTLVDIRPDGLIFVSHPHYRDRLDRAFGVGGWALVPLAMPKIQDNRVLYYGFLKAHGRYIADAVGGHQYYPNNRMGNYDNSVEAAKSDCLVRCCKALPMFRECWDKEYGDYWKATYAELVAPQGNRGERIWRKKGTAVRGFTARPDRDPEDEFRKPPRIEDENNAHMAALKEDKPLRTVSKDEYSDNAPDYGDDEQFRMEWEQERREMAEQTRLTREEF